MQKLTDKNITFNDLAESKSFLEFFEIVQDFVGTKMALIDPRSTGEKILFKRSDMNPLCLLIQADKNGNKACQETDMLNCKKAARFEKGLHYLCHAGLIDIAVPIFARGEHVATINCGQLLPEPPTEKGLRDFMIKTAGLSLEKEELKKAYFNSPYITEKKLKNALRLISFFADYYCEIAGRLKSAEKTGERDEISEAKSYILKHFREPLSIPEVAAHAGLSNAYFSSIFKKTTGFAFKNYIQKLRIEEAKKLLKETNWSITRIAQESGFNNSTHFNRTFRVFERSAPKKFRKKHTKAFL